MRHYQPTAQAALFALYSGIVPADRLQSVRSSAGVFGFVQRAVPRNEQFREP